MSDDGSTDSATMPMFPLGTVLLPYVVLPLRIFEPRYQAMMAHCMEGSREFGVVLIERGYEVGGGEDRFGVGTVARIVEAVEAPGGRWRLLTVGTRRIRVEQWLEDDPYPRATVHELPSNPTGEEHRPALETAERIVRRALALKAELAEPVAAPSTFELAEDIDVAGWQLVAYAPLTQVDQLELLAEDDPAARLERLTGLADDAASVLAYRLAGG